MLTALLLACALQPGAWGSCPPSVPVWQPPAPVFVQPAPVPMPAIVPTPAPDDGHEPLYLRLRKALLKQKAEQALKARTAEQDCLPGCSCGRCEDGCKCVVGQGHCGAGCKCLTGELATADPDTHGVDFSKIGGRPRYTHSGKGVSREVSRAEAVRLVQAPAVPDDANKPWVVIILPDVDRRIAEAQYLTGPEFAPYRSQFRLQSFSPEHWYVAHKKFRPGVTVMKADGTLAKHLPVWDRPELAKALFRASPDYDPSKDPDAKKPEPAPKPGPEPAPQPLPAPLDGIDRWVRSLPQWLIGAFLLAGLYLLSLPSPQPQPAPQPKP